MIGVKAPDGARPRFGLEDGKGQEGDPMNLRNRRRELHGLIGAIGVVVALGGFVGGFYAPTTAVVGAFAVWAIGATLVNVFTDPPA
ncbi:MAG: hypothetical protein KJN93_08375 [Alphaproteobacteria bacterium]|nr:hypothetical protein [Alphaproteobacteria bacterium]NNF24601.1 hypothetical protein [Paracoccaceae bacterium]